MTSWARILCIAALPSFLPAALPAASLAPPCGPSVSATQVGRLPGASGRADVGAPAFRKAPNSEETYRLLALLVEFPPDDDPATTGGGTFGDVLDANEAIYGSLFPAILEIPHDAAYFREQLRYLSQYWAAVSYGALSIEYTVPETILTAPEPMAYYGDNEDATARQAALLADAVRLADPLVDFGEYDGVVVFHAGAGEETDVLGDSPGDIWTAYLTLADLASALADSGAEAEYRGIPTGDRTDAEGPVFVREGVLLPESETQDELNGTPLAQWLLGVSAHMTGRLLGAPSLFDTDSEDGTSSQGIGSFGIMGTGLWNSGGILPPHPCAWTKVFFGWAKPLVVTRDTTIVLPLVERADSEPKIVKVPITADEYYLIENRHKDENGDSLFNFDDSNGDGVLYPFEDSYEGAEFDWSLPDEGSLSGAGVLIWHIDEAKIRESGDFSVRNAVNADPARKGVDLEEADGIQDLDVRATAFANFGSAFDSWRDGHRGEFGPAGDPRTTTNFGAPTGVTIRVESGPDSAMTLSISFRERPAGWPVPAPEGVRLVGPAIPVRSEAEGLLGFAYAYRDSAAGLFRANLLGARAAPLPGWPIDLPGEPGFGPAAFASAPDGPLSFWFPMVDGSIVRATRSGIVAPPGVLGEAVGGASGHLLSSAAPEGGTVSLVSRLGGTTVYSIDPSAGTRDSIAALGGEATGPAAIGAGMYVSTGDGLVSRIAPNGEVTSVPAAGIPTPPVLFGYFLDEYDPEGINAFSRPAAFGSGEALVWTGDGDRWSRLQRAELASAVTGAPAVSDIDGDGVPELVVGTEDGKLHVRNVTGAPSTGWPLRVDLGRVEGPADPPVGTPAAGDVDGDGEIEVAFATRHGSFALAGPDGRFLPGFPIATTGSYRYGVVMTASLDGDSILVLVPSEDGAFDLFAFPAAGGRIEWAGYGGGAGLAGDYGSPPSGPVAGADLLVDEETFCYPNPVLSEGIARIHFRLGRTAFVSLRVYAANGTLVREIPEKLVMPGETAEFEWDTRDVGSGVYVARIEAWTVEGGDGASPRRQEEVRFLTIAVTR